MEESESSVKFIEIIMIVAVFLGPIVAVQISQYLERKREKQNTALESSKTAAQD